MYADQATQLLTVYLLSQRLYQLQIHAAAFFRFRGQKLRALRRYACPS